MNNLQGVIPALLTPFKDSAGIDEDALRVAVEWNISQGVSGFYVGGSTAEAFLMSHEERKQVLEIVAGQTAGRVAIIAHIGSIGTDLSVDLGRHAAQVVGVNAVSSIPPFYYGFSEDEVVRYYLDLAEDIGVPVIPYNFPKISGVTLTPRIIRRLRTDGRIIGVKYTSNDLFGLERIRKEDPELIIFNGYDELFVAGLSMGADSAIGSTFNFMADKFIAIRDSFKKKDFDRARAIQTEANTVIEAMQQTRSFFGAEKYMMDILGIPFGEPRRPFFPLEDDEKAFLRKVAAEHGISGGPGK